MIRRACIAFLFVASAAMAADTGWLSPSAEYASGCDQPTNAYSSNNARSACLSTKTLCLAGFGAAVPDGATINGIEISVEGNGTGLTAPDNPFSVAPAPDMTSDCGSPVAPVAVELNPSTDTTQTVGSSSSLWGLSWTASDVNAATFGVSGINSAEEATDQIDQVRVKIYYATGRSRRMF